jgi:NAD-dependent SIR2 family protein deacetylase
MTNWDERLYCVSCKLYDGNYCEKCSEIIYNGRKPRCIENVWKDIPNVPDCEFKEIK